MECVRVTQDATSRMIVAALGPEAVTTWVQREAGYQDPFCASCEAAAFEMVLGGSYPRETLDLIADAAAAAGGRAGPSVMLSGPGDEVRSTVLSHVFRDVDFGWDACDLSISWEASTGVIRAYISTVFRPAPGSAGNPAP